MMFVGMQDRLFKEVAALAPSAVKIRVIDPPERFSFYILENWVFGLEDLYCLVYHNSKIFGLQDKNLMSTEFKLFIKNAFDYNIYY